eukprot:221420_1
MYVVNKKWNESQGLSLKFIVINMASTKPDHDTKLKQNDESNEKEINWKFTSLTQFSQHLCKIGKHLRSLELFDDAMNDLEHILIDLYANNRLNKCEWIQENEITIIRIYIFSNIQTIGQIFEPTKNTQNLIKTNLKNYKSFFINIIKCISSYSHSYQLFTKNQIKKIKKFEQYIFNYNNNNNKYEESIIEKQ